MKKLIDEKGNIGDGNTGRFNIGSFNNGSYNCGDMNSGTLNNGFSNSGDSNIGDYNTGINNNGNSNAGIGNFGDGNVGSYNTGNRNSGDGNIGDYNTGSYNTTSYCSGFFCTEEPRITIFNKPSDWTRDDWYNSKDMLILSSMPKHIERIEGSPDRFGICFDNKTLSDEQLRDKSVNGFIKFTADLTRARQDWWDKLCTDNKVAILNLPNFDADIFKEITGISVAMGEESVMEDSSNSNN